MFNPFGRKLSRDAVALPQDLQPGFGTAPLQLWLNQLAPMAMTEKEKKPTQEKKQQKTPAVSYIYFDCQNCHLLSV